MQTNNSRMGILFMSNFLKVSLAVIFFTFSTSIYAQGVKLGVVNVALLLEQAPQAKKASEALEREFSPQQTELKSLAAKLDKQQADFEKDKAVLSETQKVVKEREITMLTREIKRRRNDVQELLNLRRNDELAKLQNVVNEAIKSVGKNQNFDIILYEGIAYTNEKIDITADVLKYLTSLNDKQRSEFNK